MITATTECPHYSVLAKCLLCAADAKVAGGHELAEWHAARGHYECDLRFPELYRPAVADNPAVVGWAQRYIADPKSARSLLITGPVGTGKTYQAYGAVRAATTGGRSVTWAATGFADFCAALRPSSLDPEGTLAKYRTVGILLLDDLGAAKNSEWVEEITLRLINGRYEAMRPMVLTTNIELAQLRRSVGDRIASRLVETCETVPLLGGDRRRSPR